MATLDIIIPTWNNPEYLNPCIDSIAATGVLNGLARLIIVNNGKQPIKEYVGKLSNVLVLEPGENLGWEKGLAYGLKHSEAPFVCFQNDDTNIPGACRMFYQRLLIPFADKNIAAVGPTTTVAAGWHSIYRKQPIHATTEVSYLIFFTVVIRRSDLDAVGGIDVTAPGGDDLDLSIRLRKAGKKLIINPEAFLIHHAFKSGTRLKGGPDKPNGWNSQDMVDRTNQWLIQKHGFGVFFSAMMGLEYSGYKADSRDLEGDSVRQLVAGSGDIVELGCGGNKTVESSIGVDRVPKGELIPHVSMASAADVVADVSKRLPFEDASQDVVIARHILEHCLDCVVTLKEWSRIVRPGGRLIVAVPNEDLVSGIPMNPEHVHAFTPESLKSLMQLCGLKEVSWVDPGNGVSFVGCYEKAPVAALEAVGV